MSERIRVADLRPRDRILLDDEGVIGTVRSVFTSATVTTLRGEIEGTLADFKRVYDSTYEVTRLGLDEKLTAWGVLREPIPGHVPTAKQAQEEAPKE